MKRLRKLFIAILNISYLLIESQPFKRQSHKMVKHTQAICSLIFLTPCYAYVIIIPILLAFHFSHLANKSKEKQ